MPAYQNDDSAGLKEVDASGLTGNLNLGEIGVYQDQFTFTSGTGFTTLTLAAGVLENPTEGDPAAWTFDFGNATGSIMKLNGIQDYLAFNSGNLTIDVAILAIDGTVDFSGLELNANSSLNFNDDILIQLSDVAEDGTLADEAGEEGAGLTITADQLMTAAAAEVGLAIMGIGVADNTLTINANTSLRAFSQMDFDNLSSVEHLVFDVPFGPVPYDGFADPSGSERGRWAPDAYFHGFS